MCRFVRQKASHCCTATCEFTWFGFCQMQPTKNYCRKGLRPSRRRGLMSSVKGVSHLPRRDKRRSYYRIQFWLWRKRSERCGFWIFRRSRRRGSGGRAGSGPQLNLELQESQVLKCPLKNKKNSKVRTPAPVSTLQHDAGGSGGASRGRNCLPPGGPPGSVSVVRCGSDLSSGTISETTSPTSASLSQSSEGSLEPECISHTLPPLQEAESTAAAGIEPVRLQEAQTDAPLEEHSPVLQHTPTETPTSCLNNADINSLPREIQDFMEGFYRRYGSFIPLRKSDVLKHLRRKFKSKFSDSKSLIASEVDRCRAVLQNSAPAFRITYKKHILTLEDLQTLADENWLNDQVMNMYGELIMESSHHKVHFLNSFFHRQLMTKGYDGVRRWTKQVDLFSKSLLLVPIHLEVHWCLVTADISAKKICLYDSQGHSLQKVARNILKYLMSEAREKKQAAFEDGWTLSIDENIPQQTNENDCGVFVLEYSRCLALSRPFQFSQQDIPKIRKRIYKELCDCKLHEQD
ncbi:sentrin-specific protease 5-like isoform X2 [Cyprinodon tularosa]|uniref:sentrin-specific protease 5-like isoform X2 n=1 Tax=Cyprinodon tularosa TaxID=77115 RepID=UPI0018E278EE|nr:sentrin-specific protease 5-like isoform X2 [Cyprinodon tularosa]